MNIKYMNYNAIPQSTWAGGTSKQYFIYPENASYENKDFLVRFSSATIDDTKPFTNFIGFKRYFTMLDNSIELSINGNNLDKERQVVTVFNSEDDVISYSLGTDLNLMVAQDISESSLIVDNGFIHGENDFMFVLALFDQTVKVNNQDFEMEYLDCLVIENLDREKVDVFAPYKVFVGKVSLPYKV